MRIPGEPGSGALHGQAVHSPAEATAVETDPSDNSAGPIFPPRQSDNRTRQLEETWLLLFRELRGPVDSTLMGGLSAGDVAYRLGELVHNYFRTRGVTLTSFELRRIVVELLDNHKRGWPTLKPAPGPSAPPSSLVDFVDGDPDARAIREVAGLPPEPAAPPPPPPIEAIPSPLVEVEPRPTMNESPAPRRRPMRDLPPARERTDTLTPEQIAHMEAAAADAARTVFGSEVPAAQQLMQPAAVADGMSAQAALAAIAPAWQRRRAANPPPAARAELASWVSQTTGEALAEVGVRVGEAERARLEQLIVDDAFGLGVLEPLLRDRAVSAIMVNGPDAVFVERRGHIERVDGFRDAQHVASVLERLARFAGAPPAAAPRPLIEGRLPDGSRFVIVAPPLAPSGPLFTITRRAAPTASLDDMVGWDSLSPPMAALLRAAARGRLNILVSGRAESGRTTMLAALARTIAGDQRVVTVERHPELRLDVANVVSLVAPEAGPEMVPAIDLSLAIAAASRLRPDRLVIDGLGNGAVATLATLIDAGRDGVLASCEAASPRAAVEELARRIAETEPHETPATALRRIAGAFDLVVHLEAFRDGTRRVTHIAELAAVDGGDAACRDLFFHDHDATGGAFVSTGHRPFFLPRLAKLGLDPGIFDAA
ncbi:MAG: CpaF family protein [Alphaproteobacteria bacterium]|nr:CpaF family protein [Alphaproteobacteria bacterium]MCW5742776.1 CpaF family protein [Alphaproteobacteria bacterium]